MIKKLLILPFLFFSSFSLSYADFESYLEARKSCQEINNLQETNQNDSILITLEAMANEGESRASACLGELYDYGVIQRDEKKSFTWYLKAAKQGHPFAPIIVGLKYQQGEGVIKDYDKALYWLRKGAELGDLLAINKLVIMYEDGIGGVEQNYDEALFWTRLAVELGQKPYQEKLKKLELLVQANDDEIKNVEDAIKLKIDTTYQDTLLINQSLANEILQLKADIDLSIYQMNLLKDTWETKEAFARDEINQLKQSLLDNDRLLPGAQKENIELNAKLSSFLKVNNQLQQDILLFNLEIESLNEEEKRQIVSHLNILKSIYAESIVARVKNNWTYFGTKNNWSCDVKVIQERNGIVKEVTIYDCIVDKAYKETLFKNSIKRAIYKSSPLPSMPDGMEFNEEILFKFSVN